MSEFVENMLADYEAATLRGCKLSPEEFEAAYASGEILPQDCHDLEHPDDTRPEGLTDEQWEKLKARRAKRAKRKEARLAKNRWAEHTANRNKNLEKRQRRLEDLLRDIYAYHMAETVIDFEAHALEENHLMKRIRDILGGKVNHDEA